MGGGVGGIECLKCSTARCQTETFLHLCVSVCVCVRARGCTSTSWGIKVLPDTKPFFCVGLGGKRPGGVVVHSNC